MPFNKTVDNIYAQLKNSVGLLDRNKVNVIVSSYLTAANNSYPLYREYNSSAWASTRAFIVDKSGLTKDPTNMINSVLKKLTEFVEIGAIPYDEKSTFAILKPYDRGTATSVPDAIIEADKVSTKKTNTQNQTASSNNNTTVTLPNEESFFDKLNWTYVALGAAAAGLFLLFNSKGTKSGKKKK